MGQVLHGSATTTEAIRRAIQHSQESLRALSKRYGVNPKTVAKWPRRTSVSDVRTGPKEARSTVLTIEEEAIIVAFRRHTFLPLDECLYALQATIPNLTRSTLHRCLQRYDIVASVGCLWRQKPWKKFKPYPNMLFPHRYRRGADLAGQVLSLCRYRSHEQIRFHAARHEDRLKEASGPQAG